MVRKILLFMLLFVNLQIVTKYGELNFELGSAVYAQHMYKENGATYCSDDGVNWWRSCFDNSCDGVSTSFSCPYCGCNNDSESQRELHMAACPERPDDDSEESFRCRKYCTQTFSSMDEREVHEKNCRQTGSTPTGTGSSSGGSTGASTTGSRSGSSRGKGGSGGSSGNRQDDIMKITVYVPPTVPIGSLGAELANLAYLKRGSDDYNKKLENLATQYGIHEATTLIKQIENMGYFINNPVTGFKCTILSSFTSGVSTYVVAYAGTDFSEEFSDYMVNKDVSALKDVTTDIQQALLGPCDGQYVEAYRLAQAVVDIVGEANVTFLGHSLGGGLATIAGMSTKAYSIGYNPACLSSNTIEWMKNNGCNPDPSHVLNYIATNDELKAVQSIIGMNYQGQTQKVDGGGHSIENMIENLKREGY